MACRMGVGFYNTERHGGMHTEEHGGKIYQFFLYILLIRSLTDVGVIQFAIKIPDGASE